MTLEGWRRTSLRGGRAARAAALAAMVLSLGACASQAPVAAQEAPGTRVVLRSIPRHTQFAPLTEWVYLWDRPGGPSARAVRVARVPSGTLGLMVENEPPRSFASDFLDAIGADNTARLPVGWVKVATSRGDGWVRLEFVELR
ncbi:MAG: hypothetical protein A3J27_11435 [Candidatus Tectomicrobia bacterium RIFCSPLOWO2_12_FULL_69_37]|nr:MAG: hypothetical protein A3I72_02415 [Candidatus Tectomicrobia bacterium RIFCSPLOWO2_02_FULL_70_19]OGL68250.1 MAG: hypothetical protein A3J27_11435 [Candidatus Tectomicrobia bacterium RIFCSPLOWO2_12_FULL_69_37]